ncbi:DUF1993 domain-containing protein [Thermomonas sp.]|uniref:DUF1993 domain-containing protein n=1 Tax=Thermomonas sp. TaxID=1971895 RepID=UPI0024881226|nr:DUF1993 domain-containing protein [Thermomonas sp.]MDI1254086.1 DUF1993 domain-containing protein [Thermomonas sp.]
MPLSMHQASAPVFIRTLSNLKHVLQLGEAHATARGFDPTLLVQARLTPDMLPLVRQVQIACDMAMRGCARLASIEPESVADEEVDFAGLYARIDLACANIGAYAADQVDGSEAREIVLKMRNDDELRFSGRDYLLNYVVPNLFFHCTITYAILRQSGVALGKLDFMGKPA